AYVGGGRTSEEGGGREAEHQLGCSGQGDAEDDRQCEGGRERGRYAVLLRLALGDTEEQGRPLEVVEERDHHVDGHDHGEPAEARVDGRGEDGDLREEADDA